MCPSILQTHQTTGQRAPWTSASSAGRENPLHFWRQELPCGFGWGFGHRAHGRGSHLQQRGSGTGNGTCVDVFGTRPGHLEEGRGRGLVYDKTMADRVVSITIESCHCEETRGSTSEAEPSVPNGSIEEDAIE